jgi:hypothetical protein
MLFFFVLAWKQARTFFYFLPRRQKLPDAGAGDGRQRAADRVRPGKLFGWDIGLTAGMLAGSMTSTPVLVGAGDTLRHSGMAGDPFQPHSIT